ncbi:MAG TPA: SDR family oxidoreductase [Gemmatimonadales bacterium]|nr:SDR family oxidoreductase [Gemmatimonadales bacterium]
MLNGKVVLVTGASSGIGRAIALACAEAGADVGLTYRANRAGAEATAERIRGLGRKVEVARLDVSRPEEIDALARRMKEAFGRVDTWINNAGADIVTPQADRLSRVEKLDLLIAVDLRGTMFASWTAVELMQGQPDGGSIINMSWDHVTQGMEGENPGLYAAVKGGVLGFSKSLARRVAPRIRVNVLAPGWIETAFGEGAEPEWKRRVAESIPLRRWGRPEDVAGAAVFLASDAASYLTGQTIMVNGGDVM